MTENDPKDIVISDSLLVKVSVAVSIIGLVGIFFAAKYATLPDFASADAEKLMGKDVVVEGIVGEYSGSGSMLFLKIREQKYGREVPVVLFQGKTGMEKMPANLTGSRVLAIGEVRKFNGKPEIIAFEVRLLG